MRQTDTQCGTRRLLPVVRGDQLFGWRCSDGPCFVRALARINCAWDLGIPLTRAYADAWSPWNATCKATNRLTYGYSRGQQRHKQAAPAVCKAMSVRIAAKADLPSRYTERWGSGRHSMYGAGAIVPVLPATRAAVGENGSIATSYALPAEKGKVK